VCSGRSRVNYDDLSEADLQDLQRLAKRYLAGEAEVEELPTDSLKRVRDTYKALKQAASTSHEEIEQQLTAARAAAASASATAAVRDCIGNDLHPIKLHCLFVKVPRLPTKLCAMMWSDLMRVRCNWLHRVPERLLTGHWTASDLWTQKHGASRRVSRHQRSGPQSMPACLAQAQQRVVQRARPTARACQLLPAHPPLR
jgi:hypothetical protein